MTAVAPLSREQRRAKRQEEAAAKVQASFRGKWLRTKKENGEDISAAPIANNASSGGGMNLMPILITMAFVAVAAALVYSWMAPEACNLEYETWSIKQITKELKTRGVSAACHGCKKKAEFIDLLCQNI